MKLRVRGWMQRAMRHAGRHPLLRAALLLAVLALPTMPAFAQGCAMCYSTAAAASKDGQMALDRAVVVLLLPPLGFMTLGVGMAFRYGRKRDREQNRDNSAPR